MALYSVFGIAKTIFYTYQVVEKKADFVLAGKGRIVDHKIGVLEPIADYFNVSLNYLVHGKDKTNDFLQEKEKRINSPFLYKNCL